MYLQFMFSIFFHFNLCSNMSRENFVITSNQLNSIAGLKTKENWNIYRHQYWQRRQGNKTKIIQSYIYMCQQQKSNVFLLIKKVIYLNTTTLTFKTHRVKMLAIKISILFNHCVMSTELYTVTPHYFDL